MKWLKSILLFSLLLTSWFAFAQNKQIEKANKKYQNKEYAAAIPLYEEGISKSASLSAKTKLAYCYRINNNVDEAAALYGEIVEQKRARTITWYYYGETLMSQGKYDEARVWLKKYTHKKPGDRKGWKLLESIDKIENIRPYFITGEVKTFAHNSQSDDSAPIFFNGGIAFSSDRKAGLNMLKKKSSFTGRDFLSLYFSKEKNDGTFAAPKSLSRRLNDINKNTGTITISPDGTQAVFSRNSDISNKKNQYNLMLYTADVTSDRKFKNVKILYFCSKNVNYMHPAFSHDGERLYFTSDKKGEGGTDLFYCEKSEKKGWSRPRNVGATINTQYNEGFPFVDYEGRLFFCSKGHTSFGGFDIFMSYEDDDGNWVTPINVGQPVNSSADDISIFTYENGTKGMFASSREGGDDDIYLFDIEGIASTSSLEMEDIPLAEVTPTVTPPSVQDTATVEPTTENSTDSETAEKYVEALPFVPLEEEVVVGNGIVEAETTVEEEIVIEENPVDLDNIINYDPSAATEILTTKITEDTVQLEKVEAVAEEEQTLDTVMATTETVTLSKVDPSLPVDSFEIFLTTDDIKRLEAMTRDKSTSEKSKVTTFEEGIASVDQAMTDEASDEPAIEKNTPIQHQGLSDLKDQLVSNTALPFDASFVLESIKFDPEQYMVTPEASASLEELVIIMHEYPELKVEIAAHTESIGDDRENMIISIKRATAVAGYLIRRKINTDRVKVMGYGETQLLNHCGNEVECSEKEHAVNQRMEVRIVE
ncbi:MAG: OmpA family protein [Bacteroidota bacterium]